MRERKIAKKKKKIEFNEIFLINEQNPQSTIKHLKKKKKNPSIFLVFISFLLNEKKFSFSSRFYEW